ncbi:MAG: hypothetical protein O7I42_18765 [Alphaproteobacteria bacterium]|nr:hypothetical protein [Alphaproteobacteria bacterium]
MSACRDGTLDDAQLFLASYDDKFLSITENRGFAGRHVTVEGIDPTTGRLAVVSGNEIEHAWNEFQTADTNVATDLERKAQDFIARLREHLENLMKIMLRLIGIEPKDLTIGGLLKDFQTNKTSVPFSYQAVRSMIDELEKRKNFRDILNDAHHDEKRRTLDDKDAHQVKAIGINSRSLSMRPSER